MLPGGSQPTGTEPPGPAVFEAVRLPVAVIRKPILERNSRWMRAFIGRSGIDVAPQGKTTMIPEISQLQVADGAWAITLSTMQQVRTARRFGIERIVFANVLVDPHEIKEVFAELDHDPRFELYCLVDSREAVTALAAGFDTEPGRRPISVLVELGYPGGRTGCRTLQQAMGIARLAAGAGAGAGVRLAGVEGFEGLTSATTSTCPAP